MRERQSRRTFLGVGLGCAAPLLLGLPLAGAASRVFTSPAPAKSSDPFLDHLRGEAVRNYRQARAARKATGRIPGENLRTVASQAGLLQAYLSGRGDDVRFDHSLRLRVGKDGRDATVLGLTQGYRALRESVEATEGVILPPEPDFTSAGVAFDVLQRKGFARTMRLVRQWAEREAKRADRASGRVTHISVAGDQKPGDDFLGYSEEGEIDMSCQDLAVLIDILALAAILMGSMGDASTGFILGVTAAAAELVSDFACSSMAT